MEPLLEEMKLPGELFLTPDVALVSCRSGDASLLPAQPQDSPFVMFNISSNGTLGTSVRYPTPEPEPPGCS